LCIEPRSAEEVPEVLEEFFGLAGREGGVLLGVCGGKLAEGIDYRGEALIGVAVVGLPLAVYDDIQKETNAYYARKYGKAKGMLIAYTLPAMNRGLQAAGRVIRAESERGVLLFCDKRFGNDGLGGVRRFLPGWVREELVVADAGRCREIIKETIERWSREPVCEPPYPVETRPRAAGSRKRDLRELAEKLGLTDSKCSRQEK
jgi:DNA excision repair protein ERCC-2